MRFLFFLLLLFGASSVFAQVTGFDINPGSASSNIQSPVRLGNALYFVANDGINGSQLWKSDASGTSIAINIPPTGTSNGPSNLIVFNNDLYFIFYDYSAAYNVTLYKSSGTAAGTTIVGQWSNASNGAIDFAVANNRLLFFVNDNSAAGQNSWALWQTDGTMAGTTLVKAGFYLNSILSTTAYNEYHTVVLNNELYFGADSIPAINTTPRTGRELWKTDGTPEGTVLVKDINYGSVSSDPQWLTSFNNHVYFTANDGINGRELWKTDGTDAGITLVTNIVASSGSSNPAWLTAGSSKLYFAATQPAIGQELWMSDGTAAGTSLLKNINTALGEGENSSVPKGIVWTGTHLFFFADDGISGRELWKSDGSPGGTVMVKDIRPGSPGSIFFDRIFLYGGEVFFSANDGTYGNELWKTDGTTANTSLVTDINPGSASSDPGSFCQVNPLFFTATTSAGGAELFRFGNFAGGILPVEWVSFTAEKQEGKALLKWQTSQEQNTLHFDVLRSTDGSNYATIGRVSAAGNSSAVRSYSFLDNTPLKGINYYRLNQVDINGRSSFSTVQKLAFGKQSITAWIHGNSISVQCPTGSTLILYDDLGRCLVNKATSLTQTDIDIANRPAAFFVVKIILPEDASETVKLVKQ